MAQLPWIQGFLFIILQLTAAEQRSHCVVRDGDEVSLPAECFRNQKKTCSKTTWIFTDLRKTEALFEYGKTHKDARTKSDRLSVTANCSLVIKKISVEDVGSYVCRQFETSGQEAESVVYLSVVNMTEQKINNETILICSVSSYGGCRHSVKWLYDNKDDVNIKTPPHSACSATVSFTTSPHVSTSKPSELFRCQVKSGGDMKEFSFRISPQREKPVMTQPTKVTTTLTRVKTTNPKKIQPTTGSDSSNSKAVTQQPKGMTTYRIMITTRTTLIGMKTEKPKTSNSKDLLKFIAAAVGSVLLIVIVAAAIIWRKTKGNKAEMNKNNELKLDPAGSQAAGGSSHNLEDPAGGVAYASISYTKKTSRNTKVRGKNDEDDDDGDTVTYSKVKPSKPSSSIDPSKLYAAINKPKH